MWLAVYLPQLPLDVAMRALPAADGPVAVVEGGAARQVVVACTAQAAAAGVLPCLPLTAATALCPALQIMPRDPAREDETLRHCASWLYGFSSQLSLADGDGVLVEVAGSQRLFGGYAQLLTQIRQGCQALGYHAVLALAPNPTAAWWRALCGRTEPVLEAAQLPAALAGLPIRQLPLSVAEKRALAALAIDDLQALTRLPRAGLARRLGKSLLAKLDRAYQRCPDPRPLFVPAEYFSAQLALPAECHDLALLRVPLGRLLRALQAHLWATAQGVRELELRLEHSGSTAPTVLCLHLLQVVRDAAQLLDLLYLRLEAQTLAGVVEGLAIVARQMEAQAQRSDDLFGDARSQVNDRQRLLQTLYARLGEDAVKGIAVVADHRPERAWCYRPAGATPASAEVDGRQRPLWLLPEPRGIDWDGSLQLLGEPERIESGWWDGNDIRRDYYQAEDRQGVRYWVYRECAAKGRWYLHGLLG